MNTANPRHLRRHSFFCLLSLLALLLPACSTGPIKKGGALPVTVSPSNLKDATPQKLPLSKSGNHSSYAVHGKTYHVLKSYAGYDKTGVASWYGPKFDGHLTSSGERYNMLKMTAASKELPIPCFVKVTNLSNHKTAIVEVNDRGPFKKGRLIDLSYVAALKLGVVGRGTAEVRVVAITPSEPHSSKIRRA